jgi:hypothetical protein
MFWYNGSDEKEGRMYLGWYDPDKKKTAAVKLAEAAARYREKWGRQPAVALVNAQDAVTLPGSERIEVRVVGHVAPNTFFVGEDDTPDAASEELRAA